MFSDPIIVDRILVAAALILPIISVLALKRRGIIIGAFVQWVTIGAAGPILSSLDPKREGGILDSIWILGGWIFCLIYASFIYLTIKLIRYGLQRMSRETPQHQSPE